MHLQIFKYRSNYEAKIFVCSIMMVVVALVFQKHSGVAGLQEIVKSGGVITNKSSVVILDDFVILKKRVTWIEAVSECANISKQLVALPTVQDAKLLVEEIRAVSKAYYDNYSKNRKQHEFGMDRRYWIGLTDIIREGGWQWVGGGSDLDYDFWFNGRPNHLAGGKPKHCACLANPSYHLGDHHHFIDDDCTKKYYAVCGNSFKPTLTLIDVDAHMGYIADEELKMEKNESNTAPIVV